MKTLSLNLFLTLLSIQLFSQIPTDSLVAYYKFENNVEDNSGNNRHGTIIGNPSYVIGVDGQALDFDGVNDYVQILNSDDLILQSFTISAWVRWEGAPDVEGSWAIISNWYGGGTYQHYGLRMGTIAPGIPFNHAVIFYDDGTAWDWVYGYKEEVSSGGWHSITGVVEAGVYAKIYFDGSLVGEDNTSIPSQINPTGDLYIARDGFGESPAPVERWNGSIDEIRIYDRVLTESEIIDIYEDTPTSIKTVKNTNEFELFPNPTNGLFTIHSNSMKQIKVFDITGKNVINLITVNPSEQIVDLTNQSKGIYFVNIISKSKNEMIKLIIE